jgi:hypothetical protein
MWRRSERNDRTNALESGAGLSRTLDLLFFFAQYAIRLLRTGLCRRDEHREV